MSEEKKKVPEQKPDGPKYWLVKFNARASTAETEDVELSVNGEVLIMQRSEWVIIPDRFKECADHTLIPRFKQLPNKPRKELAPVLLYPYTEKREASEEEYLLMKQKGTEALLEHIKRFGFGSGEDG